MTTLLPPNVKVHLALGFIDMRKVIDGLSVLVQGCSCSAGAPEPT
jgi:transposase